MSGRAFAENRKTCAGAVRKSSAQGWKIVSFFSAFLYKKQNVLYKNADSLYKKNQNLLVFCSSFPEDLLGGWGDSVFFRPIIYWNSWNISFFFFVVSDKDR